MEILTIFNDMFRFFWEALIAAVGEITLQKVIGAVLIYLIIHPIIDVVVRVWKILNKLYIKSLKYMSRPFVRMFHDWVYKSERRAAYYRQARAIFATSSAVAISSSPDQSSQDSDPQSSPSH